MAYAGARQIFGPLVKLKTGEVRGIEYVPSRPPFIVAANHVGFLDAPVLILALYEHFKRPVYVITKEFIWKLWGGPLARKWVGMIPRHENHKGEALVEAISMLKHGEIVAVFPEGTRHADAHTLTKGKTGAVRMALASGAPIIPVGVHNTTGQFISAALMSLWHPSQKVTLTFGQAVDLSEFRGRPIDKPLLEAATTKVMRAIGTLCGKAYPY